MTLVSRLAAVAASISIFALFAMLAGQNALATPPSDSSEDSSPIYSNSSSSPSYSNPSSNSSYSNPSSNSSYSSSSSSSSSSNAPSSPSASESSSAAAEPKAASSAIEPANIPAADPATGNAPQYLHCQPGGTVVLYPHDGDVVINARNPGGSGYFRVGHLSNGKFVSENKLGWSVTATGGTITVHGPDGGAAANCDA